MKANILLAMATRRRSSLLKFLEEEGLEVYTAGNFQEAHSKLISPLHWDLLVMDAEIPGGSWRELLQLVQESRKDCEAIVTARCGDEQLWAEVIQCGAFDLIPEPYEKQEILRIIHCALDSQYMRRFTRSVEARVS